MQGLALGQIAYRRIPHNNPSAAIHTTYCVRAIGLGSLELALGAVIAQAALGRWAYVK